MRNIFLIARREYLERVRTRAFIIMTFLIPALMLGVTILPTYLMNRTPSEKKRITVVAPDQKTGDILREELTKPPQEKTNEDRGESSGSASRNIRPSNLAVTVDLDTSEQEKTALVEKVKQKQLDGVIFATKDALAAKNVLYVTNDVSSIITNETIRAAINRAVHRDLLKSRGMGDQEIDAVLEPIALDPKSPTGAGNPVAMFFTAFSLVMILYMTIFLYGLSVMRSIIEEKTSRIMEVMLSVAQAKEMMAGKILGVGAVALTQVLIWAMVGGLTSGAALASTGLLKGVLSIKLLAWFAVYALLGFALYSTLFAAVGAMVNSEQEAQQLQFLVAMPIILSLVFMPNIIQAPGSNVAVGASIFPFTAPLIMILRVAVQPPHLWEIGLSIAIIIATIYGLVLLCGRIYRIGILMYGKKPTLPEIMKWIKYA